MKYLINTVDTYVVETVAEVEQLHQELKDDTRFTLTSFSYKTKQIKVKGEEPIDYQLVTVKKVFNEEKNPDTEIIVDYEVV